MKKQSNIPQIRFQNFKDKWLDSTIGRHISLLNGRAYKQEELLDEGKYKVLRVGNFNTNSKWYYSNLELEENKYVNKGDLLYLWATNFGPEIWTEEKAIYHYHIWKLDFDRTEINQDYLNIWLESDKNKIQQNTNGSTMVHITKTMMEERGISLPNFDEQSAIGSLFRTLDDVLASYKDNLANYQSLKATMLSKMFPKAGQTIPEIRLDGFEGEWRIIKLGDVLSELKSGLSRELSNDDIGLPVIRANNISDGNLNLDRDIKYWFKDDPKGANTANYFVRENDILVNFINSEAKMGTAAIVLREPDRETIYTTNILKLTVKEDYYPYFIYLMTFVQSYQNYIKAITKPAVNQASFTTVDFKKYEFLCPAFQEQQAISAYFLNLDNLISALQEKISQLETLKKKLLKDMFI